MAAPSNEIVASARFDTSNFESNIDKAMNSLQKFEDKLNNAGGGESLSKLGDAAKAIDLSKLEHGIEQLTKRFSFFGETVHHVMENVRNKVDNVFRSIKEKMILDPFQGMSSGMSEYEMKMDSIKTIMSATGRSIEDVKVQLEELNKYSDETIYSFSDMTQNIGKFTNAGIKLEDAVAAMKGISNEAALSGANATEASRAMYNLSQAMSLGYMQRMDWKSIENANMATQDFKKNLAETATQVGTIKKVNDDLFQVGKKTYSLNALYVDALKEGWLTNDVMMGTLKNYADKSTDLGKRAYEAATQVSTFSKMMDTLRETMQSGWGKTWELIFGDLEEAKRLWTSINNVASSAIDSIAQQRNEILQIWHDNGGYDAFLETINNIINVVQSIVAPIKSAFKEVFGFVDDGTQKAADGLIGFTEGLRDFVRSLELSIDSQKTLREVFRVIFTALKVGIGLIKTAIGFIKPLGHILGPIVKIFFDIASGIGNFIFSLVPFNSLAKGSTSILEVWGNICKSLGDKITALWDSFKKSDALKAFVDIITNFVKFISSIGLNIFSAIGDNIGKLFSNFNFNSVVSGFHWLIDVLIDAARAALLFVDSLVNAFKADGINGVINGILHPIESVKNNLLSFTKNVKNGGSSLFDTIKSYIFGDDDSVEDIRYAAVNNPVLGGVYKLEDDTTKSLSIIDRIKNAIENIGSGLSNLFSGFVKNIKNIDWKSISNFIKFLTEEFSIFAKAGIFVAISKVINNFSNIFSGAGDILDNTADLIKRVKKSIGLVANAMAKKLRAEAFKENAKAIAIISIAVIALMAAFGGLVYVLKDIDYKTIGAVAVAVLAITAGFALLTYAASKFVNAMAGLRPILQTGPVNNGWQVLNNFFAGITSGANSFLKNAGKGIKYAGLGVALTGAAAFILSIVGALFLVRMAISSFAEMKTSEFKKGFKSILLVVGLLVAAVVAVSLSTRSISKASFGKAMSKKNSLGSFIGVAAFMFALVSAINLMVEPIKQFAAIPTTSLIKGLLSIAGTILLLVSAVAAVAIASTILTAFNGAAAGLGTFIGAAAFIFSLVSAINIMADAIAKFADIKESTMKKGLRSITNIMLCISAAVAIVALASHKGSFGGLISSVAVILALVGAIYLLIDPIKQIGAIDVDTLVKGVGAISVVVMAIGAALALIGHFGNFGAFAGLGIGLLSIVGSLLILSVVPFDKLLPPAIALGLVLAALSLAFRGVDDVSGTVSAFVGVAANIATITASLMALSTIDDPTKLIAPVVVLGSMLGMLALVFKAASGIEGDDAWKSFATIMANIIAIMVALGKMANMRHQSRLIIATACIDSILLMMAVLFKGASKINPASAKKTAAVIGVAGVVITSIIGVLGLVAYFTKDVDYKNFAAIGFATAAIGFAISKIMDVMQRSNGANFKMLMARLLVISGVISMISVLALAIGAAASLAGSNTESAAAIGAVLAVITAVVAGLMKVVEGTVAGANAKTLAARTLVLVGIFGMLSVLAIAVGYAASVAGNNTTNISAIGVMLSMITAVVIGLMAVIQHGNTVGIAKATLPIIAIFAGISAIAVAIGYAASIAKGCTAEILAIGTMISTLSGVMLLIVKFSPGVALAAKASLGFVAGSAIIVAGLIAIASIIGYLNSLVDFRESMNEGLAIITDLAKGLGNAIGAFVGGIAEGVLERVGQGLSDFFNNSKDFWDGMGSIDSDAIDKGISAMIGAIMALGAAAFTDAAIQFLDIFGSDKIKDIGEKLVEFAGYMGQFDAKTKSIKNASRFETISNAAKLLFEGLSSAPTSGGIIDLFVGSSDDLDNIGSGIETMGEAMNAFNEKTKGINPETIEPAANAMKVIFDALAHAPNDGGWLGTIVGNNSDITTMGTNLVNFGNCMSNFASTISHIKDPDAVASGCSAMELCFKALSSAPNSGGWLSAIVGDNADIGTMGTNLVNFGNCMSNFASVAGNMPQDNFVSGCKCMSDALKAMNEAPNLDGGFIGMIFGGKKDFTALGEGLVSFGQAMADFSKVEGIDEKKVGKIITLMGDILTLQQTLANIGNTGTGDFDTLADAFEDACKAMENISGYDISYSDMNNACTHIVMLARAFKECVDLPSDAGAFTDAASQFISAFGGDNIKDIGNNLGDVSEGVEEMGKAMNAFDKQIKGINPETIGPAANAMKLIFDTFSTASYEGSLLGAIISGDADIATMGANLVNFGNCMSNFALTIANIKNPGAVEAGCSAMGSCFDALSSAPNEGGWLGEIVGDNTDIGTMGTNLVNLGNCMSNFASTISHIKDIGAVESGCAAIKVCFDTLRSAPNEGGWLSDITGDSTDIATMGANLVNFGNCMANFASVAGNMQQDNFVSGCQCMSDALKAMNEAPSLDGGFFSTIFGGKKDFTALGDGLVSFGEAMAKFSSVEGIDEEKIRKIISLIGDMITLQQTLANIGNTGSGDFETLTYAFEDACESMSKISDYDISYADINNACVHIEMLARALKECVDVPSDAGDGVIESIKAFGEVGVTECLKPFIESDQDVRKAVSSFIKKIGGIFSEGAFVAYIKKQAGIVVENVVLGLEEKTNLVLGRVEKLGFKVGDAYATGVGAGVGDDVEPGVPATEMETVVDNVQLGLDKYTDGALSGVKDTGSKIGEAFVGGANDALNGGKFNVDTFVKSASKNLDVDPSALKDMMSEAGIDLNSGDLFNATGLNKLGAIYKEHTDSIEKQTKDHQTRMYNIKDTYQNTDIQRLEMYGLKTRNVTAEYLNANKSKYEKFGLDVDVIMGNLHTHTNNIAAKSSEDVTNKVSDTVNSVTDKANAGAANVKGAARSGGQGASEEVSKYSNIVLGKSESFWRAVQSQTKGGTDALVNKGQSLKKFTAESFKQIDTLWTDFQNKLAEKTKSIKDSHSMFDEATKIDPKSPEQLQKNIDSQTNQLNRYANVMASLATKIEDKDLKEKIFSMDIDKLDILEGLNNMTEEQLKHYTESMTAYSKAAENAALASMGKEREELSKQMTALMGGLEFDYNDFAAIYDGTFNSLNKYAQDQLTKINIGKAISDGINAGKESGEIKAAVEDLLKTNIFDTADAVLGMSSDDRLAAKQIGAPIVNDIAEGIRNENNSTQAVGKAIEETVTDGAKAVGDSKSLKGDAKAATEEIGTGAMSGIADGVTKYDASLLTAAINKQLKTAMDGVQKKQEIGSPSKLWRREVGDNLMGGIYVATKDPYTVNALVGSIGNVLDAMLDASVDGISGVGNTLGKAFASEYGSAIQNGTDFDYRTVEDQAVTTIQRTVSAIMDSIDSSGMDLTPVITPVIDTSVVRRDAYAINSMLNRQYSLSMASSVAASNSRKENAKYVAKQRNEAVGDAITKMANKPAEQVTNLYVDGIKYNTDEYVDGSISNFTDSIITMARMHSR